LGDFGRYFGQNKAKVSVFNGLVVYFNVGIGLTFLGGSCSTRQELYLKTGPKTQKLPREVPQCPINPNRVYAQSSDRIGYLRRKEDDLEGSGERPV
jgi:hypothetical protein